MWPHCCLTARPFLTLFSEIYLQLGAIMLRLAIAILAASAFTVEAMAAQSVATISSTDGKVLLDRGNGFHAAKAGMELFHDDRVLVSADSALTISYPDCALAITKPSLLTITKTAPCAPDQSADLNGAVMIQPAVFDGFAETELSGVLALAGVAGVAIAVGVLALSYEDRSLSDE
jgi:hypothetical protein